MINPFTKALEIWQAPPNYNPNPTLWNHLIHVLGGVTLMAFLFAIGVGFKLDWLSWETSTVFVAWLAVIVEGYQVIRLKASIKDSFFDTWQYWFQICLSQAYYGHSEALAMCFSVWLVGYFTMLFLRW